MSNVNIYRMLVVSTSNITEQDDRDLTAAAHNQFQTEGFIPDITIEAVDFGYLVWVPLIEVKTTKQVLDYRGELLDAGFGIAFVNCVELALNNRCEYLRIDPDATPAEELPDYSW